MNHLDIELLALRLLSNTGRQVYTICRGHHDTVEEEDKNDIEFWKPVG